MPRGQPNSIEFSNFSGGLNTESTPLNAPENTVKDIRNLILNRDGSLQRRKGIDYETGFGLTDATDDVLDLEEAMGTYLWRNASSTGVDVYCVQMGGRIYFYNAGAISPSDAFINFLTISGYQFPDRAVASFTSVSGSLVVVANSGRFSIYEYDAISEEVTGKSDTISVRDVFGTDGEDNSRSSTINTEKYYNLINNGWPNRLFGNVFGTQDPIGLTRQTLGTFPSANDIWYSAKKEVADDPDDIGNYSATQLSKNGVTTSEPVRGFNILNDVLNRGTGRRNLVTLRPPGSITDNYFTPNNAEIPFDSSSGGITAVGTYLGRAVFGIRATGITEGDNRSPNLSEMVFFSKTVRSIEDIGQCYGANDPTAEIINDPLDTDGGFIVINGMGYPTAFSSLGRSLFVFATNGVWEVSGGEQAFSATNIVVNKVSDVGCSSPRSVVNTESSIFFWGDNGIYQIAMDNISLQGASQNISETSIQTLFDSIPTRERENAVGIFNSDERKVQWLYNEFPNNTHVDLKEKELVLDLQLNAFYLNDFEPLDDGDTEGPYLFGYLPSVRAISGIIEEEVVADEDFVLAGAEQVVVDSLITSSVQTPLKYGTFLVDATDEDRFTLSTLGEDTFYDWLSLDSTGVDAEAYFLTNALTGGDTQRKKQIPYVTTNFRLTEILVEETDGFVAVNPSSCMVRSQWGWTNDIETGRWSNTFQAYRLPRVKFVESAGVLNYGYDVVSTRNKIRGNGKAVSFHFSSEPGKDLHMYGWALNLTVNESV